MKSIDETFLPESSSNEELEEISRKKFEPLFDEARFILKREFIDNGVDMRIEIKKDQRKPGFAFNFQLKAKGLGKKNTDGSYSKSIETKNIEYLLNNGQPAFYGFYVKNEDKFYYAHLNEVIRNLQSKNPDWEDQENHTIRFEKELSSEAIDQIYMIAMKHGIMLRELNFRGALIEGNSTNTDKIIIDFQENITDEREIRKIIEEIGFELINQGRWNEIIQIHENASGTVAKTAKYCLILGVAYYYNGHLIKAWSSLKKSKKLIIELNENLKDYLVYHFHTVKYSLGLLDEKLYKSEILKLKNNPILKYYISIEEAKNNYYSDKNEGNFAKLTSKIHSIINDPNSSAHVKFMSRCELLLHNGVKKNSDYVRNIALANAKESTSGPDLELRATLTKNFIRVNEIWLKEAERLKNEALESNYFFVFFLALIHEAKVIYQFEVFTDYIYITKELSETPSPQKPDNTANVEHLLKNIKSAYEFFLSIEHTENTIASLSLRYELLKYKKNEKEALEVLEKLEAIVTEIDSPEILRKFNYLKNNGTTHETFLTHIQEIKTKMDKREEEYEDLVQKMQKMDLDEKSVESDGTEKYHVNLFPMGYFEFPKADLSKVLTFLGVEKSIFDKYIYLFKFGVVPVCNIYYDPIVEEGIRDGNLAYKGLESTRRIYKIRKFFFENKYKRIENYV